MVKKKILIIAVTTLLVLVSGIMGAKSYIGANLAELTDIKVSNVDLSKIGDGVYTGSYKVFPVAAEVEVTVNNHRIKEVKLVKHDNGQGRPAEVIPARIVEAQTLEVDIVAGATYSSKVILKAVEAALNESNRGN